MTLQDLIDKLLGRQPASADTARQRLQLVLAHDRSDLNPELLDQMRREILEVVSRYVEIDLSEGDVVSKPRIVSPRWWPICPYAAHSESFRSHQGNALVIRP